MWDSLPDIVRLLLALAFVIGLMGGLTMLLKKLGLADQIEASPKKRRLKLVETLALDSRRRIALIQRDNKQHLVLLGINSDTVIETNIDSIEGHAQDDS